MTATMSSNQRGSLAQRARKAHPDRIEQRIGVGYARISKAELGDVLGVERQEKDVRKAALAEAVDLSRMFVDNCVSAYRERERPDFERMMALLDTGDVTDLFVYHVDRLYRRLADLERLVKIVERRGITIHTCQSGDLDLSTAGGRMVARMLGAAAQHESERMSERIARKMDELAEAGRPHGGRTPYGYRRIVVVSDEAPKGRPEYVIDDEAAGHVRWMVQAIIDGKSLYGVCDRMDAEQVASPYGASKWRPTTVRKMVSTPSIAGLRVHRGEVIGPAAWPAIISIEQHRAVNAVLDNPERKHRRPRRGYLLSRLVEDTSGQRMNGRAMTYAVADGSRKAVPRYTTADSKVMVIAADLEAFVEEAVLLRLEGSTLPVEGDVKGAALRDEVERLTAERDELAAMQARGELSMREWATMRKGLTERIDAAQAMLASTHQTASLRSLLSKGGAVRKRWADLDHDARRAVIADVVVKVVVAPPPSKGARGVAMTARLDPALGAGIIWRV